MFKKEKILFFSFFYKILSIKILRLISFLGADKSLYLMTNFQYELILCQNWTILMTFANGIITVGFKMISVFEWAENIVGKGENSG